MRSQSWVILVVIELSYLLVAVVDSPRGAWYSTFEHGAISVVDTKDPTSSHGHYDVRAVVSGTMKWLRLRGTTASIFEV